MLGFVLPALELPPPEPSALEPFALEPFALEPSALGLSDLEPAFLLLSAVPSVLTNGMVDKSEPS